MTADTGRTVLLPAERFFGDGPPNWTQGKKAKPAKTSNAAIADCDLLVERLQRHATRNPPCTALAERLGNCAQNNRCLSGACPICMRAFQRWFVRDVDQFLKRDGRPVCVISIVPRIGRFDPSDGTQNIFAIFRQAAAEVFAEAGIDVVIGGFDPGFNEHRRGKFKPHGQIQLWAFVPAEINDRARQFIRERFLAQGANRRPVQFRRFSGQLAGIAYALKGDYVRRISLPRILRKDGTVKRRRNTRLRALRVAQQCELALALDRAGLASRLFLHGAAVSQGNGVAAPTGQKNRRH